MATVTNEMGALSTDEGVSRKMVVWDAKAAERATSLASNEMENTPAKGASGFYMVGNVTGPEAAEGGSRRRERNVRGARARGRWDAGREAPGAAGETIAQRT